MPHEPLVKLPVIGFPKQVTVQSIPALATSFDGIMARFNFEPIESATAGVVSPLAFVILIGFALTPDDEPFPHPARAIPITVREMAITRLASDLGFRTDSLRPVRTDFVEIFSG